MPDAHAVLGPSAAERWTTCPASIRVGRSIPRGETSSYAEEGTCAHALGEIEAAHALGQANAAETTRRRNAWRAEWQERIGLTEEQEEEMATHVETYTALILERAALHPNSTVLLEQRVHTGVPSCWGTSDVVIVSPTHVEIIDLKYGMGVQVYAEGNPQLRLYGVGALEDFGDLLGDIEEITYTVFQPRIGWVDSATTSAEELRAWRDNLIPIAELALGDDAPFGPSEDACRWCPAAGQCRAQLEWATSADFGTQPDLLSNAELAEALEQVAAITKWCDQVKAVGLAKAYSQQEKIPGFKVVRSGGRRYISDPEGALSALAMTGRRLDDVSERRMNGIGALEKFLGPDDFAMLVAPFVEKSEGSISLVPESDRRKAIDPNTEAEKEFRE